MSTETHAFDARTERPASPRPTEVLLVGTFGGGGIHQYVDEQAERLPDHFAVSTYDMVTPASGSGAVWFLVSFLKALWAAVKFPFRSPPDVVHVHSSHRFSFYRSAFYVLFARYVWDRPVILHVHGSSFDDFAETDDAAVRWLQSVVFDASDRVIVLSEYWRDVLADRVDPGKIEVLPNSVDPDEYDPGFGDDPPHVVFVSNLVPRKGVVELVEALDRLAERDVEFRASIAGSGRLAEDVEGLETRREEVDYLGYVSEARKRELLDSGAVFVLPTYAEGLPIAMLEGMAGGNAVVSTGVGSIPEVIGEENGVLVEPGDAAALADALERLVTAPAETARMAERNRRLVEERYSWDRTTARLARMYADEVRGPPVASAEGAS